MWQHESRTDGQSLKQGLPYPISTVIQLNDYDQTLQALSWVGYRVVIGWGYNTASGDRYSEGSPSIVVMAESLSRQGQLVMELSCISLWDLQRIRLLNVSQTIQVDFRLNDLYKVKHTLQELLGGSSLGNTETYISGYDASLDGALVQFDASGPTYTSYTAASRNITEDDVLPLPAVPAVGDITYFGYVDPHDRYSVDMRTAGAGYSGIWEFWNGTIWVALTMLALLAETGLPDGGSCVDFKIARMGIVAFERPWTWALINGNTTDISDGAGAGNAAFPNKPLYYTRYRVTAIPGALTQPVASRVFVGQDVAFEIDTTDAAQGESTYVDYQSGLDANLAEVVEAILSRTLMGVVLKKDGFHARYINNAEAGSNYTYGSVQPMYENHYRVAVAIPNQIIVINAVPDTAGLIASNPSTNGLNAASQTEIGLIPQIVIMVDASTVAIANTLADRLMAQVVRALTQGQVLALLECGQEVWDLAQVVDTRLNKTYIGRVSEILRVWDSGASNESGARYQIEVTMGGLESLRLFQTGPLPESVAKPVPAVEPVISRERESFSLEEKLRLQLEGILAYPKPTSTRLRNVSGEPIEFQRLLADTEEGRRLRRTMDIIAGNEPRQGTVAKSQSILDMLTPKKRKEDEK